TVGDLRAVVDETIALARTRALRRQSIQPIVDDLAVRGLVELVPNPRHARSPRVRITARGSALVARMDRVDRRVLAAVGGGLDPAAITTTAATLRALRSQLEIALRWRGATETTEES